MAPNLFLCARTLVTPHSWISSTKNTRTEPKDVQRVEHWDSPVPGFYEYIPGRGWYLVHRDSDGEYHRVDSNGCISSSEASSRSGSPRSSQLFPPSDLSRSSSNFSTTHSQREEVRYCRILHCYLLASDFEARCRWAIVVRRDGERPKRSRFFRLDDGIAWVLCWDETGRFIPGPYRKWCLDKEAGGMRPMNGSDINLDR